MAEYLTTTDPSLADLWEQARADERVQNFIGNRSTGDAREHADAKAAEIAEWRETLEEEIAKAARIITTKRVHPVAWWETVAAHPARPDNPLDARHGVNTSTFWAALAPLAIESVTDGTGTEVDWTWDQLIEHMTPGLYDELTTSLSRAHMERDAVPFSLADWREKRASAQSSK